MNCPQCDCTKTRVTYSKELESKDRLRKRQCNQCNHKWYTITPPEKIISKYELRWGAWSAPDRVIKYIPLPKLEDD